MGFVPVFMLSGRDFYTLVFYFILKLVLLSGTHSTLQSVYKIAIKSLLGGKK